MKILVVDPAHCLSLALIAETQERLDIDLELHDWTSVFTIDASDVYAIIVPPLAHLDSISQETLETHAEAVERLIDFCRKSTIALVWCVSDEIYEYGYDDGAIEESLIPEPVSPSRRRLVTVGNRIRTELRYSLMIRLGPLFGLKGKDAWLPSLLEGLYSGHIVPAEEDLYIGPTPVDALARGICGMLLQLYNGADSWGAYHMSGIEPVSVYNFVQYVHLQLDKQMKALDQSIDQVGHVEPVEHRLGNVRRVLNCRHMLGTFGVHQKPWRIEVERLTHRWLEARLGLGAELP